MKCSVETCQKAATKKGLCDAHYMRFKRHGDPLKGRVNDGVPLAFFLKIMATDSDECVPWPYAKRGAGRGAIQWDGKTQKVHRVMCEQVNGRPPSDKHHAAHECGNGHLGCINPKHLAWKLPKENEADKRRHGTLRQKLSDADVRRIRELAAELTQTAIAKQYDVSTMTISMLVRKVYRADI